MTTPDDGRPSTNARVTRGALLISMPFGSLFSPSIGLSLLRAALDRDGLPCEIRYFNQRFAARIGDRIYDRVSTAGSRALLGDWIFAASLFASPTTVARSSVLITRSRITTLPLTMVVRTSSPRLV